MKIFKYIFLIVLASLFACEKNDLLPEHKVVGDAYSTYVEFGVSDGAPVAGTTIDIQLKYSNYAEQPIKSIVVKQEIVGSDVEEVTTIDESGATVGKLIEKNISYTAPTVASGTTVNLYVELYSEKEFPQVEATSITVQ